MKRKNQLLRKVIAMVLAMLVMVNLVPMTGLASDCSNGHTPGNVEMEENYTSCLGGIVDSNGNPTKFYICQFCEAPVDAQGNEFTEASGDGNHDKSGGLNDPNYTDCMGGHKDPFYHCSYCNSPRDAQGNDVAFYPAVSGHQLGEKQAADFTSCEGGFKEDYYFCDTCQMHYNEDGEQAQWYEPSGNHTPGGEEMPANFTPCSGGFPNVWYLCTVCEAPCYGDGTPAIEDAPTTNQHDLGEKQEANYTSCAGGHKEAFYHCYACEQPIGEDGEPVDWYEPISGHTIGEKQEANYTSCEGGFKTPFYICTECECAVDENGDEMQWSEGDGSHRIEKVEALAPTVEEYGYHEFWQCSDCGIAFFDAEGTEVIEDEWDILIPKLDSQRVVENALETVPESIAVQYPTVEKLKDKLIETALEENENFDPVKALSQFMDVELQMKDEDGQWVKVTNENFPKNGVEVLLTYPAATKGNEDAYDYVIVHMKENGEVEILEGIPTEDGIRTTFTSMSPVLIMYQEAEAPSVGDAYLMMVWFGVLALSGIAMVGLYAKRRLQ